MLDPEDIARVNAAFPDIPLDEARLRELPVELRQFRDVIERVRRRLAFDEEPAAFLTALADCAETQR
jgi:hypothetical protein